MTKKRHDSGKIDRRCGIYDEDASISTLNSRLEQFASAGLLDGDEQKGACGDPAGPRHDNMNVKDKVTDLVRNQRTRLPTLPVVVNNIIVTARNPKTSSSDLAGFIMNDQAISTKVLRIANSAYYGVCKEVHSISRAIIVIGFEEILSLALGTGVFSALSKGVDTDLINMEELWKHAIGVGFAARKIARHRGGMPGELTMMVGLLHDIGKIVFSTHFPKEYDKVLSKAAEESAPLDELERQMLGLDHTEMAFLLMGHWNFPPDIADAVRYHHGPFCDGVDQAKVMACTANMADLICHMSGIGQSGNKRPSKNEAVSEALNLSDEAIDIMTEELKSERDQVDYFLKALS